MTADPRPVRELLDHCTASLERLGVALRRGLDPAALAECAAQLTGIREGLGRLAQTMARRALEAERWEKEAPPAS